MGSGVIGAMGAMAAKAGAALSGGSGAAGAGAAGAGVGGAAGAGAAGATVGGAAGGLLQQGAQFGKDMLSRAWDDTKAKYATFDQSGGVDGGGTLYKNAKSILSRMDPLPKQTPPDMSKAPEVQTNAAPAEALNAESELNKLRSLMNQGG